MKAIIAAALVFANTCATADSGNTTMSFRTLKSGAYSSMRSEKVQAVVVRDRSQWESVVGGEMPAVDFEKETVVVLFAGMKSTGGWWIEPKGARLDGDVLVIDAPVHGPAAGDIVTQALTYPFAAVAVERRNVENVRWQEMPR